MRFFVIIILFLFVSFNCQLMHVCRSGTNEQSEIPTQQNRKPISEFSNQGIAETQQSGNRVIRPESRVTMFNNYTEDKILDYIKKNLHASLYMTPGFIIKNEKTVNIRAATQLLGNGYYQKSKKKINELRYQSISTKIIEIGSINYGNCYEEATILIYGLGTKAIPGLKLGFFSANDTIAQFASQKLCELKDREVVNWLIGVYNTSSDKKFRIRARFMLMIMRNYRDLQTPNRGISKEESDLITRELIDPFLAKNNQDK